MPLMKNGYAPKNIKFKIDKHNLARLKHMNGKDIKKLKRLQEVKNII